ncbi:DUF2478 domain-containing protein [Aliiroseovarius crassostreae]|uniref:DUF2478 domain-containing protein n=1 Tax=Aliiroseovarius crassostreae TaxID=154981 RepID=UPI002205978C|nr:DUF2478 domain-containing protein [Aliiroseovarius crassostreae]UWQ05368.1 DUF2478 domain-containing protein [Aliiroseovarius crassostreae]
MRIARISSTERGKVDQLLSEVAELLQSQGRQLAGIVKDHSHDSQFDNGCDMKVRVLPGGPVIQITQNLGAGSDACRLDPGAIANAVSAVEGGDLSGADLFVLNKFGPEELNGRGFVSAIGKAVTRDVPVLVGVGVNSRADFDAFAGGEAVELAPEKDAILNWCRSVLGDVPQT